MDDLIKNYVVQLLGWSEEAVHTLSKQHRKWAVVLIGPPGSGKGTQADLLAEKFGLVHFEVSRVIEQKFKAADPNDKVIAQEKKNWQAGELVSPELVVQWTLESIRELASRGLGIILSANPRTIYEAENELPVFEEIYGKENIKAVHLNLTKEESIRRNSSRRICQGERHTIPDLPIFKDIQVCPKDGSPLLKRELDTPDTIAIRYEVYLRRTQPVISFLQENGFKIIEIQGEQSIEDVFKDILNGINDKN